MIFTLTKLTLLVYTFAAFGSPAQDLSVDSRWQKLLHHRQIESPTFYLAPNTTGSALTEAQLSIEKLAQDPTFSCSFPARAKYISQKFSINYSPCPQVETWKKNIGAEAVALVYVSQYISNPASAFGHTFLLFRDSKKPLHMSSVLANAAHIPNDTNDFDYLYKGLTGGFPAKFSQDPFYLKRQEYSQIENREMWIYDLTFTPDEIDQLLNHIWELSKMAEQKYFFLNQNCSTNSFNALAAIHPNLDFLSPHRIYVAPTETIHLIKSVTSQATHTPSLREKIVLTYNHMSPQERREFDNSVKNLDFFQETVNFQVAELMLDRYELLRTTQNGFLSPAQKKSYQRILLNRASLGPTSPTNISDTTPNPQEGLLPTRVSLIAATKNSESSLRLSFSPFYHSLLDRPAGYHPFSEIILLDTSVEKKSEDLFFQIDFIKMANYPQVTAFDSPWSWRAWLGTEKNEECNTCWTLRGEVAIGKSYSLFEKDNFSFMVGGFQPSSEKLKPQIVFGYLNAFKNLRMGAFLRGIISEKGEPLQNFSSIEVNSDLSDLSNIALTANSYQDNVEFKVTFGLYF